MKRHASSRPVDDEPASYAGRHSQEHFGNRYRIALEISVIVSPCVTAHELLPICPCPSASLRFWNALRASFFVRIM